MNTPSFYQAYVDDYSGDGTEDSENYIDPIVAGGASLHALNDRPRQFELCGHNGYADATRNCWNTNYTNNNSISVSDGSVADCRSE